MSAERAARPADIAERVTPELQQEIEQFLYHEARILDDRNYEEWFALLADDLHYFMPTRYNRLRRESAKEFSGPDEAAFFDEDKASIAMRIRRLNTGMAWAEDPPSRTRHLVTNVVVRHIDPSQHPDFSPDDLEVRSAFLVYRNRLEREENLFAGRRIDILRRTEEGLQVARRIILLDQNVLQAKNISTFF